MPTRDVTDPTRVGRVPGATLTTSAIASNTSASASPPATGSSTTSGRASDALARCRAAGFTDDARFAAALAEELSQKKNYAPRRILEALQQKGIDRETAKNAVEGLDIDGKKGIINIIKKMRLPDTLTQKELDRLLRRLTAAGYSMREIRAVLRFSEETEEG